MGGELNDDIRMQVTQVNQTGGPLAQAQVATTVQVHPQTATGTSTPLSAQGLSSKTNATTANPNGLEPYGHSVKLIDIFIYIIKIFFFLA